MPQRHQKQAAAAHFFQPPSQSVGFRYIYLGTKTRIPIGKLRSLFRKIDTNNNRILYAHYSDRHTVALLIHNDFEQKFRDHLTSLKISINDDFNPLDPVHLRDSALQNFAVDEQEHQAFLLHCNRMERAFNFIRIPMRYAVVKNFLFRRWISEEALDEVYLLILPIYLQLQKYLVEKTLI